MSDPAGRPRIEEPSTDVERSAGTAKLPGARRDAYTKFPTGPVGIEPVVTSGPDADAVGAWEPNAEPVAPDRSRLAPWALLSAIVALVASFFVGWGIPLALVSIVAAIMSLRRPLENRAVGVWALVLGSVATLYSAGWLTWAALQPGVFG